MELAWVYFNQTPLPTPFTEDAMESQIFIPWFLFAWDPERPVRQRGQRPRIGVIARTFLPKAGSRLSELEEMILDQATTEPDSFYEEILSEPGERLVLRDIPIGGDTEVAERKASQSLRTGDICYGQIWKLPEVSTLGRMAPIRLPPGNKKAAFDALAPLAWGVSKEELWESAEVDADGTLRSVEIEWIKKGNKKLETWDNTILDRLNISGRVLEAEVNSARRAEVFRGEIEQRLGILAVYEKTVWKTLEQISKQSKRTNANSDGRTGDSALDPELEREVEAQLQRQVESWASQKIPALGGRTPIEAVGDPDGREMVEALLLDWERKMQNSTGGVLRPDIDGLRRILKLTRSIT